MPQINIYRCSPLAGESTGDAYLLTIEGWVIEPFKPKSGDTRSSPFMYTLEEACEIHIFNGGNSADHCIDRKDVARFHKWLSERARLLMGHKDIDFDDLDENSEAHAFLEEFFEKTLSKRYEKWRGYVRIGDEEDNYIAFLFWFFESAYTRFLKEGNPAVW
jgi:hypothetical protein